MQNWEEDPQTPWVRRHSSFSILHSSFSQPRRNSFVVLDVHFVSSSALSRRSVAEVEPKRTQERNQLESRLGPTAATPTYPELPETYEMNI